MSKRASGRSNRMVFGIAMIALLAYAAWLVGPYIRSILVRDASVTSWTRATTTPIDGDIVSDLPAVAVVTGVDGYVIDIRNDRLFREADIIVRMRSQLELAEARILELEAYLARLEDMAVQRDERVRRYGEIFLQEVTTSIAALEEEASIISERLEAGSEDIDRQSELRRERAHLDARLRFLNVRRDAAERGIFIEDDGSDPSWAHVADFSLELEIARARLDLEDAGAAAREAASALAAEEASYERLREASVVIPPDMVIESTEVESASTVTAGQVLVRWVDCADLLVDVPVSDAELPLIQPGTPVTVLLEGEQEQRLGSVLITRGSAATFDETTLASIAKGRRPGLAQVIVDISHTMEDGDLCPLGRAAYVRFPDVGLLDVIRARLRL